MSDLLVVEWLAIVVIFVVVFWALREVNCWYWKINKRIELQEETNVLLKQIVGKTETETSESKPSEVKNK